MNSLAALNWPANSAAARSETFVLLHGWSCDATDWLPVVPVLQTLGAAIALDLPGSGNSASLAGPYTVAAFADQVADTLNGLGVVRPVVIGHSAGCEVAVAVAERVEVRALVAVDPAYGFPDMDRDRIRAVVDQLQSQDPGEIALAYFRAIDGSETPDVVRRMHPDRIRATDEAMRETFREFAFGPGSFHFRPETDARHALRLAPLLAMYRNPVRGEPGRAFALRDGDKVIVRADAGHWPHHEDPNWFGDEVSAWLETV